MICRCTDMLSGLCQKREHVMVYLSVCTCQNVFCNFCYLSFGPSNLSSFIWLNFNLNDAFRVRFFRVLLKVMSQDVCLLWGSNHWLFNNKTFMLFTLKGQAAATFDAFLNASTSLRFTEGLHTFSPTWRYILYVLCVLMHQVKGV